MENVLKSEMCMEDRKNDRAQTENNRKFAELCLLTPIIRFLKCS